MYYQCPNCGAAMVYKEGTGRLYCESCGTEQEIAQEAEPSVQEMENPALEREVPQEAAQFKTYHCSSCGAELMTDEHTSATFCSYCGNPTLLEERLQGEAAPHCVIPFREDKNQALEAFRQWTKKGFFTPKIFNKAATVEKISGIYVPFWLYDFEASSRVTAECATVRHSSDSQYNYTHTDWYRVQRLIEGHFQKIPADASEKMDDTVMDKLEPFDYGEMVEFQMPYLSGFLSEKYNFSKEELLGRVRERVEEFLREEFNNSTARYSSRRILQEDKDIRNIRAIYAVLPVWILNYRYRGKDYLFAMNGQTGKVVADLPINWAKAAVTFFAMTLVFFLIFCVIGGVFW